ncbi:peptidylprolyl isomerase [Cohnella sp. 56]|uniref:peptidylprolyl isomerase n=1 Tax=Cohnella sp. 56 TaxID=3113722 RepID=UPI0030E903C7
MKSVQTVGKRSALRRRTIGVVMILIVLSGALLVRRFVLGSGETDDAIARVDGVPIHTAEFARAASLYRDRVASGDITAETAMRDALDDSVKIKLRQLIAHEQGVYPDISYTGFLQQLGQENRKRQQAIESGQVVFGPARYSEDAYFEYVLGQATLSAKRRLLEQTWQPDEQALQQFYEANKSRLYMVQGSVKINQLSMSFLNANQEVDEALKKQAKLRMDEALSQAAAGVPFEKIAGAGDSNMLLEERSVSLGNVRMNLRSPVAQAAEKLAVGEISGVIEENGRFYLLACTDNQAYGSADLKFEAIRDQVLRDYTDSRYEQYVRTRVAEAKIETNETKYRAYRW